MRTYIDQDTQALVSGVGTKTPVGSLTFKRGDSSRIEVVYFRGITQGPLPDGATAVFGLKEKGKYDGDYVVLADGWTKEGDGTTTIYVFKPNFNTVALNTLLASGDLDDENDVASVELMGEIRWFVGDEVYATQTFTAIVANDVNKGVEGTPLELPTPEEWLADNGIVFDPAITGLTGGGATKLDGMTGMEVDRLQAVYFGGRLGIFQYRTGTPVEASPIIIRPDDGSEGYWSLLNIHAQNLEIDSGAVFGRLNAVTGQATFQRADSVHAASLKAGPLTASRAFEFPDRAGTLLPFITIAGNITDNAGVAAVAANTMGLVVRNQDTNDWHQVTIRDSGVAAGGAANGIPQFSISDPL